MLNEALEKAGVEPGSVCLTNAVKHFRFEERGKRRIQDRGERRQVKPAPVPRSVPSIRFETGAL